MGNGSDAGFIDIDYSVRVESAREIVGKTFEDSTILGCSMNIIVNTIHNFEDSCRTNLDSYQYKENDSQALTKIKSEADLIMGNLYCVTVSNEKYFLLMMYWRMPLTWAYVAYLNKHHRMLVGT